MAGLLTFGFIALAILFRLRRIMWAAAGSALGGLCTLGIVNLTGLCTGVLLPCNLFSLAVSCCLGTPGVIGLLICQLFW